MPHRALLSSEQRTRLFSIPVDQAEMARHYVLSTQDQAIVRAKRRASNRLGFTVQLCVLRYPGRVNALRLMLARENPLGGTVEIDEFFLGGRPKKRADEPPPGRGRKGLRRTTKRPVLAVVQRPSATARGAPAGDARASVVAISRWMKSNACSRKRSSPRLT
jgi:hypothetical protein